MLEYATFSGVQAPHKSRVNRFNDFRVTGLPGARRRTLHRAAKIYALKHEELEKIPPSFEKVETERLDANVTNDKLVTRSAVHEDTRPEQPGPSPSWLSAGVKGMLLLNLSAFLFGFNQVVIKQTEAFVDPLPLNMLRFSVAALCFSPWLPGAVRNPKSFASALELGCWLTGRSRWACASMHS